MFPIWAKFDIDRLLFDLDVSHYWTIIHKILFKNIKLNFILTGE